MPHDELTRIDCKVLDETSKALLIEVDRDAGPPAKVWIPLSTVHEIHRQDGFVVVDAWIARERGLE